MPQRILVAAQVALLCSTAVVLIATSRAPICPPSEKVSYAVVGNSCGPDGEVAISNDEACAVTIDNAEGVNLPTGSGEANNGQGFSAGFGFDMAQANQRRPVLFPDGGTGATIGNCQASPVGPQDGGAPEVFEFFCNSAGSTGRDACSGRFERIVALEDAGVTLDGGEPDAGP